MVFSLENPTICVVFLMNLYIIWYQFTWKSSSSRITWIASSMLSFPRETAIATTRDFDAAERASTAVSCQLLAFLKAFSNASTTSSGWLSTRIFVEWLGLWPNSFSIQSNKGLNTSACNSATAFHESHVTACWCSLHEIRATDYCALVHLCKNE